MKPTKNVVVIIPYHGKLENDGKFIEKHDNKFFEIQPPKDGLYIHSGEIKLPQRYTIITDNPFLLGDNVINLRGKLTSKCGVAFCPSIVFDNEEPSSLFINSALQAIKEAKIVLVIGDYSKFLNQYILKQLQHSSIRRIKKLDCKGIKFSSERPFPSELIEVSEQEKADMNLADSKGKIPSKSKQGSSSDKLMREHDIVENALIKQGILRPVSIRSPMVLDDVEGEAVTTLLDLSKPKSVISKELIKTIDDVSSEGLKTRTRLKRKRSDDSENEVLNGSPVNTTSPILPIVVSQSMPTMVSSNPSTSSSSTIVPGTKVVFAPKLGLFVPPTKRRATIAPVTTVNYGGSVNIAGFHLNPQDELLIDMRHGHFSVRFKYIGNGNFRLVQCSSTLGSNPNYNVFDLIKGTFQLNESNEISAQALEKRLNFHKNNISQISLIDNFLPSINKWLNSVDQKGAIFLQVNGESVIFELGANDRFYAKTPFQGGLQSKMLCRILAQPTNENDIKVLFGLDGNNSISKENLAKVICVKYNREITIQDMLFFNREYYNLTPGQQIALEVVNLGLFTFQIFDSIGRCSLVNYDFRGNVSDLSRVKFLLGIKDGITTTVNDLLKGIDGNQFDMLLLPQRLIINFSLAPTLAF